MTTTTSPPDRAEVNRRNAQKSTGPKTPAGKNRSKFNAIKHGLAAKTLVLPGEDAAAFQGRIDAWAADLIPCNDIEQLLVERAATLSWQLERADRAEAVHLASLIRAAPAEEALRQADQAAALGQRLFRDPCGPLPLYPHSHFHLNNHARTSVSGLGDDPDDPARVLLRLEATAAGCRWLLDRWAELRALLDRGLSWQSPDKFKAVRLLGKQPLDAADSELVATLFQACHVLDPQERHQPGAAFTELLYELSAEERREYRGRLEGRQVDQLRPQDPAAARATLRAIVAQTVSRLQAKLEVHEQGEAVAAADQAARLAFDPSDQGERLRRFQLSAGRSLLRTLDTLLKIRRSPDGPQPPPALTDRRDPDREGEPGPLTSGSFLEPECFPIPLTQGCMDGVGPAVAGEPPGDDPGGILVPALTATARPVAGKSAEGEPPDAPSIRAGVAPRQPESAIGHPIARNEPTAPDTGREGPAVNAPKDDHPEPRNEPTTPALGHRTSQDESTIAASDHPGAQNEPTAAEPGRDRRIPGGRAVDTERAPQNRASRGWKPGGSPGDDRGAGPAGGSAG